MKDSEFLRRYRKNWLSVAGLVIIAFMFIIAVLGYLIVPDQTPFANDQSLSIAARPPMFKVKMVLAHRDICIKPESQLKKMFMGAEPVYREIPVDSFSFKGDSILLYEFSDAGKDGLLRTSMTLVDAVYAIAPDMPVRTDSIGAVHFTDLKGHQKKVELNTLQKTFLAHQVKERTFLLGTDRFGRDMLSRLVIGSRVSFSVGFISVFISLIIGISMGMLAGYYRSVTDFIVTWFINVVWSVPTLLMVLSITLVLGKGFWQVFLAVGLTMWVEVARVVRGQVLSLREKEFIEAARALGFGDFRILFRHILPNIIGPIVIISAANFATAILMEAGLSFLGLGVQPPVPSWGSMIKDHYGYIILNKPYLAILPGIAIMLLVLAFNFTGNGLRDAFDTRMEKD